MSLYSLPRPWSNVKVPHLALQGVSTEFVLIGCVLRKRSVFILYFTHPTFSMRTNSVLTSQSLGKQGAVLSRYSHAPKVKKCGFENKYLLTFSRSALAKDPSTLRKNLPQTPRKIFLSNVKKIISEVKTPFFGPKKEEKTRCLWALSSLLVQR